MKEIDTNFISEWHDDVGSSISSYVKGSISSYNKVLKKCINAVNNAEGLISNKVTYQSYLTEIESLKRD